MAFDRNSKKIISYIDSLTRLSEIGDIFTFVSKELKSFKKVKDIYLCYRSFENNRLILHTEKNSCKFMQTDLSWSEENKIRLDDRNDSQFLANTFMRPIGRLIAFPVKIKDQSDLLALGQTAILFLEHGCKGEEVHSFIDTIRPYIEPINYVLERAFLELYLKTNSLVWQNTFDGLMDPISIIDEQYNVLRSNNRFSESRDDKCYKRFSNREAPCQGCQVEKTFENDRPVLSTVYRGNQVFQMNAYSIKNLNHEKATHFICHYVDITKKQELLSQMLQGEKLAVIGNLAGSIAHELNNPLTGVKSLAEVLVSEISPEEQIHSDLTQIKAASVRCQNIIKNLLMFSGENKTSGRSIVSMREQVKNCMTLLKTSLEGLNVYIDLEEVYDSVYVVPELLIQVIFNLVQNACQASEPKGRLLISTNVKNRWVNFTVEDSGPGIPEDQLKDIFTPFFTTKKRFGGTGLGLSISKSVIDSFSGKILVANNEAKGAKFSVVLPLSNETRTETRN